MSVINYPDGTSLTSTALSDNEVETAMQVATAQMIGVLTGSMTRTFSLVTGSPIARVTNTALLYQGESLSGTGVADGTLISGVSPDGMVVLDRGATATGDKDLTVTDPDAYFKVRIGWQEEGQPGPQIDIPTVTIRCSTFDTEFSRMRDNGLYSQTDSIITYREEFTRCWKTYWTFYGPNSSDHARAVKSALTKIQFIQDLLAQSNLYVNPSIEEASRGPELFQGRWWDRVDLMAEFNEQITETTTVGTVQSVEVKVFDKDGQILDFTLTQ